MLKFHHKKERVNFTAGWITSEALMVDDDPDVDFLRGLLEGDGQDGLDLAIRFINDNEDN